MMMCEVNEGIINSAIIIVLLIMYNNVVVMMMLLNCRHIFLQLPSYINYIIINTL